MAANAFSPSLLNQFLAGEADKANRIFDDLQGALSTQQGEMALFARELRQVLTQNLLFFLFLFFFPLFIEYFCYESSIIDMFCVFQNFDLTVLSLNEF